MAPSLTIITLVLECRAGCWSLFMWVFFIAISAPILLDMFAWPLLFIRDSVKSCINRCGRFHGGVGVF